MANKKQQLNNDLTKFVEQSQWAKAVQALQGLVDLEPELQSLTEPDALNVQIVANHL